MQGGDLTIVLQAGLPNITGSLIHDSRSYGRFGIRDATGAYYASDSASVITTSANPDVFRETKQNFDASRCSIIYGSSETVQPPALCLIPQIKY